MTWEETFRGIPHYLNFMDETVESEAGDLADYIAERKRNRPDHAGVRVPIASLIDIAKRIDAQSREIARLSGLGPAIDASDVEAEEARLAKLRSGVLVVDGDKAALYGTNLLDASGQLEWLERRIELDAWTVNRFDAPGFLSEEQPSWPSKTAEFQQAFGAYLRRKRAAEVARGREADRV